MRTNFVIPAKKPPKTCSDVLEIYQNRRFLAVIFILSINKYEFY